MKLHFLYRITNCQTKRYYIGSIVQADVTWLSVPTRLAHLPGREHFHYTPQLLADIRAIGQMNFVVEALHASALPEDIERMKSRLLTPEVLKSDNTYNRVHTSLNPEHNEAKRQKMIELNATRTDRKQVKSKTK